MIYFDNSATTELNETVLEAMLPYLTTNYGNPSSTYKLGQTTRFAIDNSRRIIAQYINCSPQEIIFTSGGTESTNLAIKGVAEALAMDHVSGFNPSQVHIITTKIEHSATLSSIKHLGLIGYQIHFINVDNLGQINVVELENLLKQITNSKIIASFHHANSEIGTIQNIDILVPILKRYNALVHLDAMQSFKFYDINTPLMNADLITFAPHKFGGPKGIGALYIKKGTPIIRQSDGGQQEYYLRAGTENVAGIVGFGKAIEILKDTKKHNLEYISDLQLYLETSLHNSFKEIVKFNSIAPNRMPSITSVSFKNTPADQMLIKLDMNDICVSAGSACNSGSVQISPVLREILSNDDALNTIRFSLGPSNTKDEIDEMIDILKQILN